MSLSDGTHIIDGHQHVGVHDAVTRGVAGKITDISTEEYRSQELAARVAMMDAYGVDQAIVIPGHAYMRPEGNANTIRVNDEIAAYRDAMPDRFPAAIGIVEPLHGQASYEELHRIKDELGLLGASFHVRFQGVATNSVYVMGLVKEMERLELRPYIHSLGVVCDEAWWRVQDLAESIPETPILVLDPLTTSEHAREAIRVAEKNTNLYFDTSGLGSLNFVYPLIDAVGPERIVFGTNTYSSTKKVSENARQSLIEDIARSDRLDAAAKQLILADNLRRFLGLK